LTQENATVVRRFADEVITQGQIDRAVEFVWEDVLEQVPLPGQGPGIEGLKDILRTMRTGFPDLVFSIQEQIAERKGGEPFRVDRNSPGRILRGARNREAGLRLGHCHRSPGSRPNQRHPNHHGYHGNDDATGCDSNSGLIGLSRVALPPGGGEFALCFHTGAQ
jgi:hypothetical protein